MDISYYLIKPEAITFSNEIRKIISSSGLVITKFKTVKIPTQIINVLYCGISKDKIEATEHFMCESISEVGIVEGPKVIEKLVEICGMQTNPNLCKVGTIRQMYGVKEIQFFNRISYFQNAIHTPRSKLERDKSFSFIEDLF